MSKNQSLPDSIFEKRPIIEEGDPFKIESDFVPSGDQPQAISQLTKNFKDGERDQVLLGVTGSGKTFAFALPIVEYLRKNNLFGSGKTQAIFMAPTRELAI